MMPNTVLNKIAVTYRELPSQKRVHLKFPQIT
ncbi:hypothetical protein Zm00014a_041903 [Zea mays]|uniref:Uncharacterized protein n=1 Tax=Zea mays TaxID=4577 RepID=A0A3L6DB71_MAIZE|nr:hypothetical protein Zm00014a_041903 [Zea mays]